MTPDELRSFDPFSDISDKSEAYGYILEVDLNYPASLHCAHHSFPLAPEKVHITDEMLSPLAKQLYSDLHEGRSKYKADKLTATFGPRKNYICHGQNLLFYLQQGLELVKIHKGVRFWQTDYIRPFVEVTTRNRARAQTKAMSNVWKLLSNSLYGKLLER